MNFKAFRSNYLLEITSYLNLKELMNFQLVCKHFRECFLNNKELIQKRCLKHLGLDYSTELLQWNEILESLHVGQSNLVSTFMPYYTDGGIYMNSPLYFIHNLTLDIRAYCSEKEKNILVKYAYSKSMDYPTSDYPLQYHIGNGMFYLQEIEEETEKSCELCPYIREIDIGFPPWGYTCPADVYMCFSSIKNMQDLSFINNFRLCCDTTMACSIGKELGISSRFTLSRDYDLVVFEPSQNDIQALFWVKYKYDVGSRDEFTVRLNQGRFAKYFYLLLISARYSAGHKSIDMGKMIPFSNVIRITKCKGEENL